ncbi:MAG: DNA primase catalytic subunit PriS [Methanomicrobiales archaeon]|nr:DNA primase catalytic subunit PriS [Methanomicrobiales archaeon]MDI6875236.1 DNA primase catalytic subunit PriS [Methanomicrobiales archaeon]
MRPATAEFLKQRFTEYYRRVSITPPAALEQREWGFVFFDPGSTDIRMRRHIGFGSAGELSEYVRTLVPAHIYYSSAYYEAPSAATMPEKRWSGADLIFDLDADHIMRGPYHMMLERVREEAEKLLRMLIDELGFSERSISVVFSGGRGYHIHVNDIAVRTWGSQERREIVDYVCGIGLDSRCMAPHRSRPARGWRLRYQTTLLEYLRWILQLPEGEAHQHCMNVAGMRDKEAKRLCKYAGDLLSSASPRRMAAFMANPLLQRLIAAEQGEFSARLRKTAALADEPVTTDVKRLIRLPTSLHGGSGMRVTPLSVRDLPQFDPLVDAVIFGERDVRVEASATLSMRLLGNTYAVEKGENTVPEALAVFLCCRGLAEIAGSKGA